MGLTITSDSARVIDKIKQWARNLKRDVYAVWLAARDSRTPWLARVLALAVAAYAVSPIDLIPDFIPLLGYLDDLIVVPLGIALVIRLIPNRQMAEHRLAASRRPMRPVSYIAAALVIVFWFVCVAVLLRYFYHSQ